MQKAGEGELGVFANPLTIEAGKERGGGRAIETLVVIKNFNFQSTPQSTRNSRRPKATSGAFRAAR